MDGVVRYRFLSMVGEGGFGKVYRARMEAADGFEKDVAIKVLSDDRPAPSLLERFRDEAKILGLVRDRAIVGVEPPIRIGERWAVVMEFVDGVSCGAMMAKGPIPPGVAVEIVGEVARALHSAFHQEGPKGEPLQLLHRDVKPDNLQITPSGDVRLLDFGIARANFEAREFHTRHSLGGTPGYIAPERLQRIEVPEGDVFSLGVVLHELVTGARPKFPPTVNVETRIRGEVLESAFEGVLVETEDLEVDPALKDDEDIMAALTLAGWMRAYEPSNRPSAREVEEACRELRQTLAPPYFRNWAEAEVPHRVDLAPDEMVGQVLSTNLGMAMDYSVTADGQGPTLPGGTHPSLDGVPLAPAKPGGNVAMGAVLGGSFVLALSMGLLLVVAAMVGLMIYLQEQDQVTVVPPPDPTPEVAPLVPLPVPQEYPPSPVPVAGTPVVEIPVVEIPVVEIPVVEIPVRPAPPAHPIPVVTVPEVAPEPARVVPDPPAPVAPVRRGRTGFVIVKTVPSGATVWEQGRQLTKSGLGYELRAGYHSLEVRSTSGERHKIPVDLKADDTVEICYSFDTNGACAR